VSAFDYILQAKTERERERETERERERKRETDREREIRERCNTARLKIRADPAIMNVGCPFFLIICRFDGTIQLRIYV
jgi:hypothetical protein